MVKTSKCRPDIAGRLVQLNDNWLLQLQKSDGDAETKIRCKGMRKTREVGSLLGLCVVIVK